MNIIAWLSGLFKTKTSAAKPPTSPYRKKAEVEPEPPPPAPYEPIPESEWLEDPLWSMTKKLVYNVLSMLLACIVGVASFVKKVTSMRLFRLFLAMASCVCVGYLADSGSAANQYTRAAAMIAIGFFGFICLIFAADPTAFQDKK